MIRLIKRKWIEALKSGKYTQVQKKLRDEGKGRCCLGVLCDVVRKEKHVGNWKDGFFHVKGDDPENAMPPDTVYNLCNLNASEASRLARMNDRGKSFKEIADFINKNL